MTHQTADLHIANLHPDDYMSNRQVCTQATTDALEPPDRATTYILQPG